VNRKDRLEILRDILALIEPPKETDILHGTNCAAVHDFLSVLFHGARMVSYEVSESSAQWSDGGERKNGRSSAHSSNDRPTAFLSLGYAT
jgi:hypothetical protein